MEYGSAILRTLSRSNFHTDSSACVSGRTPKATLEDTKYIVSWVEFQLGLLLAKFVESFRNRIMFNKS